MKKPFIAHRREKDGESQNLWDHLEETSIFAGQFAEKVGLRELGELIGLFHDLGKASREFDQYIRSAVGLIDPDADEYVDAIDKKGKIDHSSAGAQIIYRKLFDKGREEKIIAQILSLCIASHHSGLIDCLAPDGQNNYERRMKKLDEKTHTDEVWENFDKDEQIKIDNLFKQVSENQPCSTLKKLKEKNDSQETLLFKYGLLVRFLLSCLIDADRLSTANFEFKGKDNIKIINQKYKKYQIWDVLIKRFNARKFENHHRVNILRNQVSEHCFDFSKKPKGLYQLTVPTGGGKTFSSLRFALYHARLHKMDRIIYVIPYTSIIDQNADEVRTILEEKDRAGQFTGKVVLEHHSNLTPEKETRRQNLLAENWDAPVVFTTSVQFLEALFSKGTRSARRMHQLANAVIIFDEVQTIPIRCVHMFNIALRFLVKSCGSTVLLCTATQPLLEKIEPEKRALQILPEQRIVQDVKSLFYNLKRVKVHDCRKAGGWTDDEVADLVKQEIQDSGSVLIVVNTKKSARNLYNQLRESGLKGIFHLSTDMCPVHRMKVLGVIKKRLGKESTICVSTQLIEAGVDIDFGSVIRYLAGLDSIAQASGRCNRNGRRKSGNVFVVNPQQENLDRLKEIRIGAEKAERVLDEFRETPDKFDGDIIGPAAMEQFYRYYFYDRKEEMKYPVSSKSPVGRQDNLFELFSTNWVSVQEYERVHQSSPALPFKQSFKTASNAFHAIDSSTYGIVVPYKEEGKKIINELCSAFEVEKQYKLLKKAQRYSINVYKNVFKELYEKKIIYEAQEGTGIFYLDSQYYSSEFGLSKEIVNEMPVYLL